MKFYGGLGVPRTNQSDFGGGGLIMDPALFWGGPGKIDSWHPSPNPPDKTDVRLNCTKFGQFFLIKIIKIVGSRSHVLKLCCMKFDFDWGSQRSHAASLAGF